MSRAYTKQMKSARNNTASEDDAGDVAPLDTKTERAIDLLRELLEIAPREPSAKEPADSVAQ